MSEEKMASKQYKIDIEKIMVNSIKAEEIFISKIKQWKRNLQIKSKEERF